MTDFVHNKLTLVGPREDVDAFVERANSPGCVYKEHVDDAYKTADHIDGGLDITTQSELIKELEEAHRSVLQFSAFVPIAKYKPGCDYNEVGYKGERVAWGVKWGAFKESLRHSTTGLNAPTYFFQTAYDSPGLFLVKVSNMYPSITFLLSYHADYPHRGRWVIKQGTINKLIDEQHAPDFGDKSAPEYIEDEAERSDAWETWGAKYHESHDEWIKDAAFVDTLEKALAL